MGRAHRPFYRVCAFDHHAPRDGRALEELGTYDTSLHNTDARAVLNAERIDYWLSVGAQPTEKVAVLIKKYGKDGTHLDQQKVALEELAAPKSIPAPGAPASLPKKPEEAPAAEAVSPEKTHSETTGGENGGGKDANDAEAAAPPAATDAADAPAADAPAAGEETPKAAE